MAGIFRLPPWPLYKGLCRHYIRAFAASHIQTTAVCHAIFAHQTIHWYLGVVHRTPGAPAPPVKAGVTKQNKTAEKLNEDPT